MNNQTIPTLPINPKVSGSGVVLKKDGTVSKPELKPEQPKQPEQLKEQDNGRNS